MTLGKNYEHIANYVYGHSKTYAEDSNDLYVIRARDYILAGKLQALCNEKGTEIDTQLSGSLFHQMARIYRQESPDKISLIRSAVLFNAALIRKPDHAEKINGDLRELCCHVLQLANAVRTDVSLTNQAEEVAKQVIEMRNAVSTKLEEIMQLSQQDLEEIEGQLKRIRFIEELQKQIQDSFIDVMDGIMRYCVSSKGKPPCDYAVVGMGSLARMEVTPFSDFEHVILLQEGVQFREDYQEIVEHFRWVTVMFHIVVINLGETILPWVCFPCINDPYDPSMDWFYNGYTKQGICFDAMMPYASKVPLGRAETPNKLWSTELIKPVSDMLGYLDTARDLKDGYHLADVLSKHCFVSGSRDVYETFHRGVTAHQRTLGFGQLAEQIEEDTKNLNPIRSLDQVKKEPQFNLKRVVYRSTSLFICALGRLCGLEAVSNFSIIRKLLESKVIDTDFAHDLLYCLAMACEVRLKVYLEKKQEDNWVRNPTENEQFEVQLVQLLGMKTSILYYQTAMKLQREIMLKLGRSDNAHVQQLSRLDKLLACFWLQLMDEALCEAKNLRLGQTDTEDGEEQSAVNAVTLAIGEFYFKRGFDLKALNCYHLLEEASLNRSDQAYRLNRMARSLHRSGNSEAAIGYASKEIATRNLMSAVDGHKRDIFYCLMNKGQCHVDLKAFDEAMKSFCEAKEYKMADKDSNFEKDLADVENMIGKCFYEKALFSEAREHFEKTVSLVKKLPKGEARDEDVAQNYYNLGQCHFHLNDFQTAKCYLVQAVELYSVVENVERNAKLAECKSMLGNSLYQLGKCVEAIPHYEDELAILMATSDDKNKDVAIAKCHFNLAQSLYRHKNFHKSSQCFMTAKAIFTAVEDSLFLANIASCSRMIGKCFYEQRMYVEAIEQHENEMNVRKQISDVATALRSSTKVDEAADPLVARCYFDQAQCYHGWKRFDTAIKFFQQAASIFASSSDAAANSNTAECFAMIGRCFYDQRQYEEAIIYHDKELRIRNQISKDKDTDTAIARCLADTAYCHYYRKDTGNALVSFNEAATIFVTDSVTSAKNLSECTKMLGRCLYDLSIFEEAITQYKEELGIRKQISSDESSDSDIANCHFNIANCYFKLDKISKALQFFEQAAKTFSNCSTLNVTGDVAECSAMSGICMFIQGNYDGALKCHEKELTARKQLSAEETIDADIARCYSSMGHCHFKLKRFVKAAAMFEQVKAIWSSLGDGAAEMHVADPTEMISMCIDELKKCN